MQRMILGAARTGAVLVLAAIAPWLLPAAIGDEWQTAGWLMAVVASRSMMPAVRLPVRGDRDEHRHDAARSGDSRRSTSSRRSWIVIPATLAFGVVGWAATLPVVELMFGGRAVADHAATTYRAPTSSEDAGVDLVFAALPAIGALAGLC